LARGCLGRASFETGVMGVKDRVLKYKVLCVPLDLFF
jgi:hypothetical protein